MIKEKGLFSFKNTALLLNISREENMLFQVLLKWIARTKYMQQSVFWENQWQMKNILHFIIFAIAYYVVQSENLAVSIILKSLALDLGLEILSLNILM